MNAETKSLPTKPGPDADRRAHQAQVKQAIVEGQTFGLTYLLARLKDRHPYDNYRVPDRLAEFEFTLKGVLRLEMMEHPVYRGWRRLFGSNTKARDLSSWRSYLLIKAFADLAAVRTYIEADPLLTWSAGQFPWPEALPPNDWYVLFQVLLIEGGRYRWSNALEIFLTDHSALLELVGRYDILPPQIGGGP
jgi:hypothetical protein